LKILSDSEEEDDWRCSTSEDRLLMVLIIIAGPWESDGFLISIDNPHDIWTIEWIQFLMVSVKTFHIFNIGNKFNSLMTYIVGEFD